MAKKHSWTLYEWLEGKYHMTEAEFKKLPKYRQQRAVEQFIKWVRNWGK